MPLIGFVLAVELSWFDVLKITIEYQQSEISNRTAISETNFIMLLMRLEI